jgi:hypothetical protein
MTDIQPQTLAWLRQSAVLDGSAVSQTLLNLLERVEALERRPIPGFVELAAPTPEAAPVATDEELLAMRSWSSHGPTFDSDLVELGRACYDLGRQHGAAQLLSLKKELERERLRLAACGVVAMADTPESAASARDIDPSLQSASLDSVVRQVDALMEARATQPPAAQPTPPAPEPGEVAEAEGPSAAARVYRDACASGDKSTIFAAAIAWHCEASWMASRRAKESHRWADVAAKAADCVDVALKELKSEGL